MYLQRRVEIIQVLRGNLREIDNTRTSISQKSGTCHDALRHLKESSSDKLCERLEKHAPNQFDRISSFKGDHHIVPKPDNHPVIHAPRKYPIHIREEIKTELDDWIEQGITRRKTEWVNNIVYVRKSNGRQGLCLDAKDMNRAITWCHHKTLTVEKLAHKLSDSKFFFFFPKWMLKMDTGRSSSIRNHSYWLLSTFLVGIGSENAF